MHDVRRLQAVKRRLSSRRGKLRLYTSYRPCGGYSIGQYTGFEGLPRGHRAAERREDEVGCLQHAGLLVWFGVSYCGAAAGKRNR